MPTLAFHKIVGPDEEKELSRSVSSEMPLWFGPRKLGQSAAREKVGSNARSPRAVAMTRRAKRASPGVDAYKRFSWCRDNDFYSRFVSLWWGIGWCGLVRDVG